TRVRVAQKVAALAERLGLSSLARLPEDKEFLRQLVFSQYQEMRSPDVLLEYFRARKNVGFFGAFTDRDLMVNVLKGTWPLGEESLLREASAIARGKFNLLGFSELDFGIPVEWNYEPLSGKRPPMMHWSQISELDAEESADKKIIWELNRHQH